MMSWKIFKMKYLIVILGGLFFVLLSDIKLSSYNVNYYNWTYQANPISNESVFCFENTSDCGHELETIKRAAATWNDCPANFSFPRIRKGRIRDFHGVNHSDNQNQIGWLQNWTPEYDETALAVISLFFSVTPNTNRIEEADVVFNDNALWSTDSIVPRTAYDIESVILHEFGHWAGLRHSLSPSVMQISIGQGDSRRELDADDIDGLFAIYNLTGWEGSRLTANEEWSIDPDVAVGKDIKPYSEGEGNIIHTVWADKSLGNYEIFYRRHSMGGNSKVPWEGEQRITSSAGTSRIPAVGTDKIEVQEGVYENHVYIVWIDNSGGNNDLYFVRSINAGGSWDPITKLTNNEGDSNAPAITVSSDHVIHIVWMDNTPGIPIKNPYNYEIYYMKSTDHGISWTPEERLTFKSELPNMFALSDSPDIAADSQNQVHIVWRDNRFWATENIQIFHKKSQAGPVPWTPETQVTTYVDGGGCFEPAITIADTDDFLHVVFTREMPGTYDGDIIYLRSMDGGSTWQGEMNLSANAGYSMSPDISSGYITYGQNKKYVIHVVWHDETPGEEEIFYSGSATTGAMWNKQQLSSNNQDCYQVAVGTYEYNIHVVWSQIISPERDYEIHHLRNRARF